MTGNKVLGFACLQEHRAREGAAPFPYLLVNVKICCFKEGLSLSKGAADAFTFNLAVLLKLLQTLTFQKCDCLQMLSGLIKKSSKTNLGILQAQEILSKTRSMPLLLLLQKEQVRLFRTTPRIAAGA